MTAQGHSGTLAQPANLIVHVKATGVQPDGTGRGRMVAGDKRAPYALRLNNRIVGQQHEGAADGTTSSCHNPNTNTIYRQPNSKPPTLIDPVETARADLANGTANVAGTVTIDGQSRHKIELGNGDIGYFDQTDYRPVYLDKPAGGRNRRAHARTHLRRACGHSSKREAPQPHRTTSRRQS